MPESGDRKWRMWGPVIFASMLFVIAAVIKFSLQTWSITIDMASEFALWATGVLFTLAATSQNQLKGRTEQVFRKKEKGAGIVIDYIAYPPDELNLAPKYLYLFVYSMLIWVLALLLGEQAHLLYAEAGGHTLGTLGIVFVALAAAATSVGCAIRALLETS